MVDILRIISIMLIIVGIFSARYNLGYPLHFNMWIIGSSKYSAFYKEGIGFKVKKGTGYIIQKINTKDFNNIKFNLNNNIENGNFYIYLLDKNKNCILKLEKENGKKILKVNTNEVYYLRVIYEEIKGKFDLTYNLLHMKGVGK